MKWIRRIGVYALLFALLAGLPRILSLPPSPPDHLAARKYEGYAGVLTLWVCEEWSGGTLLPWLNSCLTAFERAHKGVYVQATPVCAQTMACFAASQVASPDALLFSPGQLEDARGLSPLTEAPGLRQELARMGQTGEGLFALPVALGGYGLALNRALLGALPGDWSALEAPAGRRDAALLNVPADSESASWSAALIALFSGTYAGEDGSPPRAGEGVDLGLPTATPAAQATPAPRLLENALPAVLPGDFRRRDSVYAAFTGAQAAAIPVTQRELHRLALLSDRGRAPDCFAAVCGTAFTDQAALFAVSAGERPDREARIALCEALLSHLLSGGMQEKLTSARLFRATEGSPLYAAGSDMGILEAHLAEGELLVPPAFSSAWRQEARALCDRMQSGELTPRRALEGLRQALSR